MKNQKMKWLALFLLATVILQCFALSSCNQTDEKDSTIPLSAENYSNYFYETATGKMDVKTSGLNTTYFVNTVHITFDLKQTADVNNVVIKGKVDLPLSKTHPLYAEKKLPLDFTVNINVDGHGETDVFFQHGVGSYGGYSAEDYYLTIESITGSIKLK